MRLDKFLKITKLIKRRTVANESSKEGFISVNGRVCKPSYSIKAGDIICIESNKSTRKVKVIEVPVRKAISKEDIGKYIEIIDIEQKYF